MLLLPACCWLAVFMQHIRARGHKSAGDRTNRPEIRFWSWHALLRISVTTYSKACSPANCDEAAMTGFPDGIT